jgi:hypothetical protein
LCFFGDDHAEGFVQGGFAPRASIEATSKALRLRVDPCDGAFVMAAGKARSESSTARITCIFTPSDSSMSSSFARAETPSRRRSLAARAIRPLVETMISDMDI